MLAADSLIGRDVSREAYLIQLKERVASLRAGLRYFDPALLAARTGSSYEACEGGQGKFCFSLWGRPVVFSFPDFFAYDASSGEELSPSQQALVCYYFSTSDGAPAARRWISFSELPDGRFYTQAFQGYTGQELAGAFQNDHIAFARLAEELGGVRHSFGGAAYAFQVLPRVALLVVHWQGDEDFPASFQILFDAAVPHHLPTDACAILGGLLTGWLTRAKGA